MLFILAVSFLYSIAFDLQDTFGAAHRLRYTSGLSNPGIYSKLIVTTLWLCLLLFIISKDKYYLLFIPGFFYLLIIVDLRTDLYGSIVGITALLLLNLRGRKLYIAVVTLCFMVLAVFVMSNLSLYDLDILTSGRIHFWLGLYNASGFDSSVKVILFGTGEFIGHYDNQWLKTLIMFGLTGFILYCFAFVYFYKRLYAAIKSETDIVLKGVFKWGLAIWIMFAVMGVTTYIFPSLGNLYNIVLLPMVIAVSYLVDRRRMLYSHNGISEVVS